MGMQWKVGLGWKRKLDRTVELVSLELHQQSQVRVLQQLAAALMVLGLPRSFLARLLIFVWTLSGMFVSENKLTLPQYRKVKHLTH